MVAGRANDSSTELSKEQEKRGKEPKDIETAGRSLEKVATVYRVHSFILGFDTEVFDKWCYAKTTNIDDNMEW